MMIDGNMPVRQYDEESSGTGLRRFGETDQVSDSTCVAGRGGVGHVVRSIRLAVGGKTQA